MFPNRISKALIVGLLIPILFSFPLQVENPSHRSTRDKSQIADGLSVKEATGDATGLGLKLLGHVGGRINKVVTQGNYAYFVTGPKVIVFNVSNPTQPVKVGQTSIMPDLVENLTVEGNYLYTANGKGGIYIFDITNPTLPQSMGSFDTSVFAYDIDVQGIYAYVADSASAPPSQGGLRILNISNPGRPTEVRNYSPLSLRATKIIVQGRYAYVADAGGSISVIDVSNFASIRTLGYYGSPSYIFGLALSGSYLYVADRDHGVRIIDISTPETPREVGYIDTPGQASEISLSGTIAYVADGGLGLRVIDVSNPEAPEEIGSYNDNVYNAQGIAFIDSYIYLADTERGLTVVNADTPSTPTLAGSYDVMGYAQDVAVSSNRAYVASRGRGLSVLDISDLTNPRETGFYSPVGVSTESIASDGSYAYLGNFYGHPARTPKFEIVDISNPNHIAIIGETDINSPQIEIQVVGDSAYVAGAQMGLSIVNMTSRTTPYVDSTFMSDPSDGQFWDVEVIGQYAYLPDLDGGYLRVVDISIPYSPTQVGLLPIYLVGNYYRLAVNGNNVYIPSADWFTVANISDPARPLSLGANKKRLDYGSPVDVAVIGNYAFLTYGDEGIRVIDVSDPWKPRQVGYYDLPGTPWSKIRAVGNYLFIADFYGGLFILEWTGPFLLDLPFRLRNDNNPNTEDNPNNTGALFRSAFNSHITVAFDHNKPEEHYDGTMLSYLGYKSDGKEYPANPSFRWPDNIACSFSILDCYPGHTGYDFTDNNTDGKVYSAASGTVSETGWKDNAYGNMVTIDHGNGYITRYAHMDSFSVVKGQTVDRNISLGEIGCTGNCDGSHIHFEVLYNNGFQSYLSNPGYFLDTSGWMDPTYQDPWRPSGLLSYNIWRFDAPWPTSQTIDGESGGSLETEDGMTLNVEAGSYSGQWVFTITPLPIAEPNNNLIPTGQSFNIIAEDFTQSAEVSSPSTIQMQIEIHYSDEAVANVVENSLSLYFWNEQSQIWEQMPTSVDKTQNLVSASASQLGYYALLGESVPPPLYLPLIYR